MRGLILLIAKTPGNACDLRPEREAVPAVEISSGQPVTSSFPTALRNRLKRKLLIEPWLLAPLANGVEDAF